MTKLSQSMVAGRPGPASGVRLLLGGAALLALLALGHGASPVGPSTAHAETFVVTLTGDPVPDGCANNGCSLREAIIAANADTSEAHVIQLSATTYSLQQAGGDEGAAATGDLDIAANVDITIEVPGGGNATIDANDIDRVFHVLGGGSLTLNGITVTDGTASAGANVSGGGILNEGGELELIASDVTDNVANGGGGGNLQLQRRDDDSVRQLRERQYCGV